MTNSAATTTTVAIREAQIDDAAAARRVMHAAHGWNAANGFNFTASYISLEEIVGRFQPPGRFYVAQAGGRIVGTIEIKPDDEDGSAFWLMTPGGVKDSWGFHMLTVLPDCGIRGVGRHLVDFAAAETHRRGAKRLTLDTPENHPWLPAYYRSMGFEPIAHYQWEGKNYRSVVMARALP